MVQYPNMRYIPGPKYDKDVKKILAYFKEAYNDLYNYLLMELQIDPTNPRITNDIALLKTIDKRMEELGIKIQGELAKIVTGSFKEGQAYHLASIGAYRSVREALEYVSSPSFLINKVEAIVSDTYEDLLFATENTSRHLKKIVRDAVAKTMQYSAVRDNGRRSMTKLLSSELSKQGISKRLKAEGFVGIVDKAGRRWQLSTYSEMVVRTKLVQAHTEGIRVEASQTGKDLAIISSHGADDACGSFEGMIISVNGGTEGYPTYDELKTTGKIFHPNCRHTIHSIRDPGILPKALIERDKMIRQQHQGGAI